MKSTYGGSIDANAWTPSTDEQGFLAKDPITIAVERNRMNERARSTVRAQPRKSI